MCYDIVEIWFGIANGQISLILMELSACDKIMGEGVGGITISFICSLFCLKF